MTVEFSGGLPYNPKEAIHVFKDWQSNFFSVKVST